MEHFLLGMMDVSFNEMLSGTVPNELCSLDWFGFNCTDKLCGCDCLCESNATTTNLRGPTP